MEKLPRVTFVWFAFPEMAHAVAASATAAEALDRARKVLIWEQNVGNILNFTGKLVIEDFEGAVDERWFPG